MKQIYTCIFIVFSYIARAQVNCDCVYNFSVSAGLNVIDSSGERNPSNLLLDLTEKIALGKPFEVAVNYHITKRVEGWGRKYYTKFDVYAKLTTNQFLKGQVIDGILLEEPIDFRSFDIGVNYYFLEIADVVQFFATLGGGVFTINTTSTTANGGVGVRYWLNDLFGFYTSALGKFVLGNNEPIQSNHYQYSLGVVFRL